ncbi:hypothetical protein TH66_13400 [Carbonactinospora thermoautotrophica]|uniref:Uncharacterized protein n=1 Tax=Carbonactinospora thermoautotrophica TaxID=1469144 RepID=A0A132N0X3_9ACTN|nr:hypothetical protein TH66_13400 [Carbonactinospora thermoautotrophica]KWX06656.1 hypothetical protein TR74_21310 [Carbonactinospora thermoautotrophica]
MSGWASALGSDSLLRRAGVPAGVLVWAFAGQLDARGAAFRFDLSAPTTYTPALVVSGAAGMSVGIFARV